MRYFIIGVVAGFLLNSVSPFLTHYYEGKLAAWKHKYSIEQLTGAQPPVQTTAYYSPGYTGQEIHVGQGQTYQGY